jgi:hypothetical protein
MILTGAALRFWPHFLVTGAVMAAEICKSYCNCAVEDISDMSDLQDVSQKEASLFSLQLPNL